MADPGESPGTNASGRSCRLAVSGLILAPLGLLIADANHLVTSGLGPTDSLSEHWQQMLPLRTPIGLVLFVLGVVVTAFAVRKVVMPDPQTSTQPRLGSSPRTFLIYLGGLCLYALLIWHLTADAYTHWDIFLLISAISLIAGSLAGIDRPTEGDHTTFGLTDLGIAAGIAVLVGVVNSVRLTAWNFSWVGDEFFFYRAAREILNGGSWNFFDLTLVFDTHPTADSLYQALVMKLFGADVVGWRLSEVLLIAVTAAVFYLLTSSVFGRHTGIFVAIALGCNHTIIAFVRIGYNNLHSVPIHAIAVFLLILCWKTRRSVFYFLLGCSLGFCFYTFMPAILMVGVVFIVLVFDVFEDSGRRSVAMLGICIFGFVLVVTPALIVTPPTDFFGAVSVRTVAHPEFAAVNSTVFSRAFLSFVVYWFNPGWASHYVSGSILDHLSGFFFAIGLLVSAINFRSRLGRLALIWFFLGLFVVTATSYVDLPHFTRMIALMPAVALLIAMGFRAVFDALSACPKSSKMTLALVSGVLVTILLTTNLFHVFLISPNRIHRNWVMLTMKVASRHPDTGFVTVGSAIDNEMQSVVEAYPEIRSRWIKSSIPNLERTRFFECKTAKYPIFIAFDKVTADRLDEYLPSSYRRGSEIERLSTGKEILWFFVPEASGDMTRDVEPS